MFGFMGGGDFKNSRAVGFFGESGAFNAGFELRQLLIYLRIGGF